MYAPLTVSVLRINVAVPDNKADAVQWLRKGLEAGKDDSEEVRFSQQVVAAYVYTLVGNQSAARDALVKAKAWVTDKNTLEFIDATAEIGDYEAAFALMKEKNIKNPYLYAAIGEYQAKKKDGGAKASLLLAQENTTAIDDVMDNTELLHHITEQLLKIGTISEARSTLNVARTALESSKEIFRGIPILEALVTNARLQRKSGDTAGAKTALDMIEKKTMDSPYVDNERGMVLFEVAAERRALGDAAGADTLNKKAGAMIAKIESDGNEATMFQRALGRQAAAGDFEAAMSGAQKGWLRGDSFVALMSIGNICDDAGEAVKAKQAYAAARTAADMQPVLGLRLRSIWIWHRIWRQRETKPGQERYVMRSLKRFRPCRKPMYVRRYGPYWLSVVPVWTCRARSRC